MGTCRVTVRAAHAGLLMAWWYVAAGAGTAVLQLVSGRRVLMACNMQTVFKTSGHVNMSMTNCWWLKRRAAVQFTPSPLNLPHYKLVTVASTMLAAGV
jgi:hypothetical protein